ncbi:hypothetical protein MASR2M117_17260 [Paludibacter sp.]
MRKTINFMLMAAAVAIFSFSSCNDIKPKKVTLKTVNDSINYTLGQWQGDMFKQQYFAGDSTGVQLKAFIEALDKAYKNKESDEMYDLGVQVGKFFSDQKKNGLYGDSILVGDIKLLMAGMVNALNDYQEVITSEEADSISQKAQEKIQAKRYGNPQQ